MAKEPEFLDDFSNAFANTQSRPLVTEIATKAKSEASSNKVTETTDKPKAKSSKKKTEDMKCIQAYIPASLYKKIVKSVSSKVVKDGGRLSVSSHIRDILEAEFSK